MKYLQIIDGAVVSAFYGPQDATDWPGLIEVEDDDPRYVALMSPVEPNKKAVAYSTRDSLLAIAALRIAPLQDAVDVNRATDDEVTRLKLWKGYRIDLNRIEQQEGFPADVQWPLSPDEASAVPPDESPAEDSAQ